jgi:hypothetical protein
VRPVLTVLAQLRPARAGEIGRFRPYTRLVFSSPKPALAEPRPLPHKKLPNSPGLHEPRLSPMGWSLSLVRVFFPSAAAAAVAAAGGGARRRASGRGRVPQVRRKADATPTDPECTWAARDMCAGTPLAQTPTRRAHPHRDRRAASKTLGNPSSRRFKARPPAVTCVSVRHLTQRAPLRAAGWVRRQRTYTR